MHEKTAVLDLGTNTFHLLIAKWGEHEQFHIELRKMEPVLLGEGDSLTKRNIPPSAWERGLSVLEEYKQLVEKYGVEQVVAVATEALRAAENGKAFLQEVENTTGIEVQLISGEQEATFVYYGARQLAKLSGQPALFMDLGGGSVEFMIGSETELFWQRSLPLGAARLMEQFHQTDPISQEALEQLTAHLNEHLSPVFQQIERHNIKTLVGVSGSFEMLYDLVAEAPRFEQEAFQSGTIRASDFKQLYHRLIESTQEERLAVPGMVEFRAPMMPVAIHLAKQVWERLSKPDLQVVNFALKEGVLWCSRHRPELLATA
jgi:exopolyphosphatase/guanosine-5'-triphosphate,3'-diphosphate pyrophosphatase